MLHCHCFILQSECDQMHRFSLVVNDLQASETVGHKTAVLTFINAIINCTPDITERIRIRNEFIGMLYGAVDQLVERKTGRVHTGLKST